MIKRSEFITFSRGLAILTVVVFHFLKNLPLSSSLSKIVNLGGGGVHLFIFASGFGLALASYEGYAAFLKKRFSKVLIPYYVTISIIFLANCALAIYPHGIDAYLSHILLYKMFSEKFVVSFGAQFWFISTILQFYLLYPLINLFVKSLSSYLAILVSLLISISYSILVVQAGFAETRIWNSFFLQYLWEFVLGMVVARSGMIDILVNLKLWKYLILAAGSYVAMYLLVKNFGAVGKNVNDVFSFLGYVSIVLIVYKLSAGSIRRFVLWIEPFSFSLFLIHYFVYDFFRVVINHGRMTVEYFPIILVVSLVIGYYYNLLLMQLSPQKTKVSSTNLKKTG